jgi:hypothetical protein
MEPHDEFEDVETAPSPISPISAILDIRESEIKFTDTQCSIRPSQSFDLSRRDSEIIQNRLLSASLDQKTREMEQFITEKTRRVNLLRQQLEVEEYELALLKVRLMEDANSMYNTSQTPRSLRISTSISFKSQNTSQNSRTISRSSTLTNLSDATSGPSALDSPSIDSPQLTPNVQENRQKKETLVEELFGYLEEDFRRLFSPKSR